MTSTLGGSRSPPASDMEMHDPAVLLEIAILGGNCAEPHALIECGTRIRELRGQQIATSPAIPMPQRKCGQEITIVFA